MTYNFFFQGGKLHTVSKHNPATSFQFSSSNILETESLLVDQ